MADFKRRSLKLSTGKQIKLFGNSIAIGNSLEIGEGYAPNIFSCTEQLPETSPIADTSKDSSEPKAVKEQPSKKFLTTVVNPHRLTDREILEIADYNIRLWMDLKDNIRKYGTNNPKVFSRDGML